MAKPTQDTEVMMFGEPAKAAPKVQRAEIITRGADGKMRVDTGGEVKDPGEPRPERQTPAPTLEPTAPEAPKKGENKLPLAPADWQEVKREKKDQPTADWQEDPKGNKRKTGELVEDAPRAKRKEGELVEDEKRAKKPDADWQEAPKPAKKAAAKMVPVEKPAKKAVKKAAPPAKKAPAKKAAATKAAPKSTGPRASSNPSKQSKAIAETVVGSFVGRLKTEAQKKGGHISVADIDAMQPVFDEQAAALQKVFEQSFEAYAVARDRAYWDQARNFPFDRVIVKKFSHLFKQKVGPTSVSRRALPGFFMALSMMLGPDVVESYQERCRMIVERIRDGREDFDWEDVYAADETSLVTMDAQVTVVEHFEEFAKRAEWMINLVNGHLAAPTDNDDAAALAWEMTEAGFQRFLDALLQDLRDLVASDAGRKSISKRHGAAAVERTIAVLRELDGFA